MKKEPLFYKKWASGLCVMRFKVQDLARSFFFFWQDSLLLQPLSIRRLKCVLALCYRNQDKLWPDRALDLSVYLTFLPSLWAISKTASNIGWNVKYLLLPPPPPTHTNKQINIPSPCQLIYNDCPPSPPSWDKCPLSHFCWQVILFGNIVRCSTAVFNCHIYGILFSVFELAKVWKITSSTKCDPVEHQLC